MPKSTLDLPIQQLEAVVNVFKRRRSSYVPLPRGFQPLWNFCNIDGDDEASLDEMITCFEKAADYYQMPETMQNFLLKKISSS